MAPPHSTDGRNPKAGPSIDLWDHVHDAVIVSDPEYVLTAWNKGAERLYGWRAEEVLGRSGLPILDTQFPVADRLRMIEATNQRGFYRGEATQARRDGGRVQVEIDSTVLRDASGNITGYLSINRDVTERKRAEAELHGALALQKALTDNAAHAIISATTEGIITSWNPAAEKMLGYTADEMVGLQTPAIFHLPEEVVARAAEFTQELGVPVEVGFETFVLKARLGKPNVHEWTYVRKDGSRFPVMLHVTAIRDGAGGITGYLGVAADLSARKRMEEELRLAKEDAERASLAKSEFLATMSHEIRTPLNGVLGMAHLLLESGLTSEQRELALTLRRSGGILMSLINGVLDYSKIEAGELSVERTPLMVESVIRQVVEVMSPLAADKGLSLAYTPPEGRAGYRVFGDLMRVHQVLMNLLGNAIKFTKQGSVVVSATPTGQSLRIAVADTGVGIPEAKRSRIFKRFSQADASTTRQFGGTGLGLAISSRLVDLMGGTMDYESRPDVGSTFWFTLPLAEDADDADPDAGSDARTRRDDKAGLLAPGLRVLLAEDNLINQQVARGILARFGCHVDVASNGREAVTLAKAVRYDLILMDCQMPEMDGFAASTKIRQWETERSGGGEPGDPRNGRAVIVALTAGAMTDERDRCFAVGMDAFLSKPFDPQALGRVVAGLRAPKEASVA